MTTEVTPYEWVENLTNGKFVRGRLRLASPGSKSGPPVRCCLGVLRDLQGSDEPDEAECLRHLPSWLTHYDQQRVAALNDGSEPISGEWVQGALDPSVLGYIHDIIITRYEESQGAA